MEQNMGHKIYFQHFSMWRAFNEIQGKVMHASGKCYTCNVIRFSTKDLHQQQIESKKKTSYAKQQRIFPFFSITKEKLPTYNLHYNLHMSSVSFPIPYLCKIICTRDGNGSSNLDRLSRSVEEPGK
jgi:hypothetical protein